MIANSNWELASFVYRIMELLLQNRQQSTQTVEKGVCEGGLLLYLFEVLQCRQKIVLFEITQPIRPYLTLARQARENASAYTIFFPLLHPDNLNRQGGF